jgi:type IV pilus assembly protein PilM
MLKSKSFLSLDFGAGTLKIAEFEPTEAGGMRLKQFGLKPMGLEGSQDAAREGALLRGMQELLAKMPSGAKNANVCAPGFQAFSKFVKLPPVDSSKVTQIIQYEAQQNVPFPLAEVVWDYQILGTTGAGELEVLLVAIKTDLVEGLFRIAEGAGLRIQVVDVAPAALANAFRYNYGDLEGCSMLLDIGAKTSNVLFFEKGKVFARTINIGANSITQEFGAEARLRFNDAEKLKIEEGFVSLGGAYEEPENPRQAQISKVARQVLTRLHIQVNQTIQFYRGQQGGSAPLRVFLAGGASIMGYTSQFFAEKLSLPVEYFNPFRNIEIDPGVNVEELSKVAHAYGEVVGLGLRNLSQCPVELNLMPKSALKRQQFNSKKPFFLAAIYSLVAVVFIYGWFYSKVTGMKQEVLATLQTEAQPLKDKAQRLEKEEATLSGIKKQVDQVTTWTERRFFWADLVMELRRLMIEAERAASEKLGVPTGLWIESFKPDVPGLQVVEEASEGTPDSSSSLRMYMMNPALAARYGLRMMAPAAEEKPKNAPATNEIAQIKLQCRGVNHTTPATANHQLTIEFQRLLKSSTNLFLPDETGLSGELADPEPGSAYFTFGVNLRLRTPIKL